MASWHDGLYCHCLDCDAGRACHQKTQRQRGLPVCVIRLHSLFDSRSSCLFQPYRLGFPLDFRHQLDRVRKIQKETASIHKQIGRTKLGSGELSDVVPIGKLKLTVLPVFEMCSRQNESCLSDREMSWLRLAKGMAWLPGEELVRP